ncbi:unnamed protein product [Anisakis simplex]|uniref:Transposase n=1 Tax=Anisakis simplex TaxID=6269 RepID=A0A0M3JEA3_ANISI|nr:unnamed protein product [Anisakis simplex]
MGRISKNDLTLHLPGRGRAIGQCPHINGFVAVAQCVQLHRLQNMEVTRDEIAWLSSRTLCMLASTEKGRMYDVRSVYGLQQSIATRKALHEVTSKRSTVLTGLV